MSNSNLKARELIASAPIVIDMVFVYEAAIGNDVRMLKRWRDQGFHFIQGHPAGEHSAGEALHRIAQMRAQIRQDPTGVAMLVETVDDILAAKQAGKVGVGIQLESFTCLEKSLDLIEAYYQLGVRLCHPIWNSLSPIGGGCVEQSDTVGLTVFGRRVVAEMNRVGMLVDGAHAGYRTQRDMLEYSSSPVVFSHHGIYGIKPQVRNLRDDVIDGCAKRGGIVGITGGGFYLGGQPSAERFFQHIDYVVQRVGPMHVGLGIDYLEDVADQAAYMQAHADLFPGLHDGAWDPVAFMPPEQLPAIVACMINAGYDVKSIHAILGGNWLRICKEVWK
jgi:membrane dipeptidase